MKETLKTSCCGLYFCVLMFCETTLKKDADVDSESLTITYKTGRCHNLILNCYFNVVGLRNFSAHKKIKFLPNNLV
jgi:hypothetical protein